MQDVVFIVNPVAGAFRQRLGVDERARLIERLAHARQLDARLQITTRVGEAKRMAGEAVKKGIRLVVAWGGDGTINEVASALVYTNTALGVVPAGSGNGFAGTFALPHDPARAIALALDSASHRIDVGEIGGRYFFNVAGIGLDASVADAFNRERAGRRGLSAYVRAAASTLMSYRPATYSLEWNQPAFTGKALMIVVANGRQYGNNFVVAPDADPCDGLLDVAVAMATSKVRDIWRAVKFAGRRTLVDGRTVTGRCRQLTVACDRPMALHVDGEPVEAASTLHARAHHAALWLRCAAGAVGATPA